MLPEPRENSYVPCRQEAPGMARHRTTKVWLRLTYFCCGIEWTDEWPHVFKTQCPDCGVLVEALEIVVIERRKRSEAA
jgi:hypothetical protein